MATPQTVITPVVTEATKAPASSAPPKMLMIPLPPVSLGCDPELFLVDDKGRIVGSERVLPQDVQANVTTHTTVVTDGVQVELHPGGGSCRQGLSSRIRKALTLLKQYADTAQLERGKKVSVSFEPVVRVSRTELLRLSTKAQNLGCGPSFSAYGTPPIEIDGMIYRKRSAAGHIHLGQQLVSKTAKLIDPDRLARLCDIIVGNTLVLIEPNHEAARERRKNYGRAGEYRTPSHGFEYRTPGNFWLRAYPLMSLVTALCRQALGVAHMPHAQKNPRLYPTSSYLFGVDQELLDAVDEKLIQRAINKSDPELAWKIFEDQVVPILFSRISSYEGINAVSLADFRHFASKPIMEWFPADPYTNWQSLDRGWESFLAYHVQPSRLKAEKQALAAYLDARQAQA